VIEETTMKNVTLSADERLIEQARAQARAKNTTLNEEFRRWLEDYTRTEREKRVRRAMESIDRIRAYTGTGGRKFTRDEMNER
jgi:hypothetical protein